jgi:hypothetical protein
MSGDAVISDNTTGYFGGGVYAGGGEFTMSGSAVVDQNNDVYLPDGRVITVGALTGSGLAAKITPASKTDGMAVLQAAEGTLSASINRFTLGITNKAIVLEGSYGVLCGPVSIIQNGTTNYYASITAAIVDVSGGDVDNPVTPVTIGLLTDITIDSSEAITLSGKHVKLVPEGADRTISRGASDFGSLFTVQSGASLTLEGSGENELIIDGGADDGLTATETLVKVLNGGTLTMNAGATLTSNYNSIYQGNTTYGGGVYVNNSIFNMKGGTISETGAMRDGGGVYITGNSAVFTMEAGSVIENNRATFGAGVYIAGGNFYMTGGIIQNNTAEVTVYAGDPRGGGVLIGSGTFRMTGGEIRNNRAENEGGGVMMQGGSFIKNRDDCSVYGADDPLFANTAGNRGGSLFLGSGASRNNVKYNDNVPIISSGQTKDDTF